MSLSTDHHTLGDQFITNQEANLCTTLTRLNRIENNKVNVPSQDVITFQPTVLLPEYMNYWSRTSNALTTLRKPLLGFKVILLSNKHYLVLFIRIQLNTKISVLYILLFVLL
jgi:hypothetical protein